MGSREDDPTLIDSRNSSRCLRLKLSSARSGGKCLMVRALFCSRACRCRSGGCRNLRRRKHFIFSCPTSKSIRAQNLESNIPNNSLEWLTSFPDTWDSGLISDTSSGEWRQSCSFFPNSNLQNHRLANITQPKRPRPRPRPRQRPRRRRH
jgi:hypothetical protein